jgi:uncharacterized membrane protein/O-antigen ligase
MASRLNYSLDTLNSWLIGALLFLLPFEVYPFIRLRGIAIRPSHIIAVVFVFINLPRLWQNKIKLLQNPWLFLVVFLLIAGASLLYNGPNKTGIYSIILYSFEFLLAFAISLSVQKQNYILYRNIIFVSGSLVAIFGLYQLFADSFGVSQTYTLLANRYIHSVFGYPRIHGFSFEPLFFAGFLFIPFCLAIVSWVIERKAWLFWLTILFASTILLTISRSAWLGLVLVFGVVIVVSLLQKRFLTALKALGCLLATILITILLIGASMAIVRSRAAVLPSPTITQSQFVETSSNTSTLSRLAAWKLATKQFIAHPVLGIGPSNVEPAISGQISPMQMLSAGNSKANNVYLEILAEEGLLGSLALFGFAIGLVWLILRVSKKQIGNNKKIWIYGIGLVLATQAIQWNVVSNLAVTHTWILVGLLVSVTATSKISFVEKLIKKLKKSAWLKQNKLALIICVVTMGYYLLFLFLLYRKFQFPMLDLGLFNRHMFGLARLSLEANPLKGYNLLGDHSHFFLLALLPLYILWQKPEFLLFVQALFIVLSGWPIYLIAKKYSPNAKLAALWLLPYFMFFGFWSALAYPFHDSAAAVLPRAWVLYFLLVSKNYRHLCIALAVLLLFREDMPLVAIMVAIYLIIIERKYWLGAIIAVISSIYFYWVTKMWLPMFGSSYGYEKTPFGNTMAESVKAMLLQPLAAIKTLFIPAEKLRTILAMLFSFGGLAIFALEILILLLPLWLGRFLSIETWRWSGLEHYSASQGPILAAASIVGLYRVEQYLHKHYGLNKNRVFLLTITLTTILAFGINFVIGQKAIIKPLALKFYKLTPGEQSARWAIKLIPEQASVGAQSAFAGLSSRQYIYNLPLPEGAEPEYIILSPDLEKWPFANWAEVNDYKKRLDAKGYQIIFSQNNVFVLKR